MAGRRCSAGQQLGASVSLPAPVFTSPEPHRLSPYSAPWAGARVLGGLPGCSHWELRPEKGGTGGLRVADPLGPNENSQTPRRFYLNFKRHQGFRPRRPLRGPPPLPSLGLRERASPLGDGRAGPFRNKRPGAAAPLSLSQGFRDQRKRCPVTEPEGPGGPASGQHPAPPGDLTGEGVSQGPLEGSGGRRGGPPTELFSSFLSQRPGGAC